MATIAEDQARQRELRGILEKVRGERRAKAAEFDITKLDGVFPDDVSDATARVDWYEARAAEHLDISKRLRVLAESELPELSEAAEAAGSGAEPSRAERRRVLRGPAIADALDADMQKRILEAGQNPSLFLGESGDEVRMSLLPEPRSDARALATWTIPEPIPTELIRGVRNNIDFLSMIPRITMESLSAYTYYRQSVRTNMAAPADVDGTNNLPESAFAYVRETVPTQMIGHFWPVLIAQMDDIGMMESEMREEGVFGVMERLMTEVLVGTGTGESLTGINTRTGVTTHAKTAGTDIYDALLQSIGDVETNGRDMADFVVMHPTNFWAMRREENGGTYPGGLPSEAGRGTVEGIPVVRTTAQTLHTATVGALRRLRLIERWGVRFEVTNSHANDFTQMRETMRATGRYALAVLRPASMATATALNS